MKGSLTKSMILAAKLGQSNEMSEILKQYQPYMRSLARTYFRTWNGHSRQYLDYDLLEELEQHARKTVFAFPVHEGDSDNDN